MGNSSKYRLIRCNVECTFSAVIINAHAFLENFLVKAKGKNELMMIVQVIFACFINSLLEAEQVIKLVSYILPTILVNIKTQGH